MSKKSESFTINSDSLHQDVKRGNTKKDIKFFVNKDGILIGKVVEMKSCKKYFWLKSLFWFTLGNIIGHIVYYYFVHPK